MKLSEAQRNRMTLTYDDTSLGVQANIVTRKGAEKLLRCLNVYLTLLPEPMFVRRDLLPWEPAGRSALAQGDAE